MAPRDRIKRLENQSGLFVVIPQPDGSIRRFPKSAVADAYIANLDRAVGRDVPEHPLSIAARNSGNPELYLGTLVESEDVGEPPEDLSD